MPVDLLPVRGEKKNRRSARHEENHQDLGRSRGGFGTKIHLVTDRKANPIGAILSPGQAHDLKFARPALESVCLRRSSAGRPRNRPSKLAGDKGYSYKPVRDYLANRGIEAVIPTKSNQRPLKKFDRRSYRARCAVEQCVGWLKENRRVGTRYEKLSRNFLAMVQLAMIRRHLRKIDSVNRA